MVGIGEGEGAMAVPIPVEKRSGLEIQLMMLATMMIGLHLWCLDWSVCSSVTGMLREMAKHIMWYLLFEDVFGVFGCF